MVELHEGTIEVQSQVDEGSTFTMAFPACVSGCRESRPVQKEPSRQNYLSFEGVTVLVVEDEPINMKLARNLLKRRGFEVLEATSGAAARAMLRMVLPDLILMDVNLGGENGLDITRSLKRSPRTKEIPVVALSAYASEADKQKARDAGCAGYITKPIRLNRLAQSLAVVLQKFSRQERAV
jgi:CheY-like chemotaxis protein